MSGYSSIFSAGLLATARPQDHTNSADYTTPDCSINMDSDSDTTPTKFNAVPTPSSEDVMNYFAQRGRASSNASATSSVSALGGVGAPRLRRRRSSLSVANNGLSAVKSPQRSAGMALQRTALMSPGGRARSGSTDMGSVDLSCVDGEGHGLVPSRVGGGRSRSGSTSGAMRARRALRKPPPVPPPNVPLPPLPTTVTVTDIVQRRPLMHRARTSENFPPLNVATLNLDPNSSAFFAPALDFTNNLKVMTAKGNSTPSSSPLAELSAFWGSGPRMNEN
ncbi:hypothetical protein F5888DRAFT_1743670 [Russula emetica]|nr:hypothetical protein F5888DRAFT_1743670 [Russula emetica]